MSCLYMVIRSMELFQKKYRIKSTRLQHWNYGSNGFYFVTISTKNRLHSLGRIENSIVILFRTGEIASLCWQEIPSHFVGVSIDEFVIMPNHVHGIVIINRNVETSHVMSLQRENLFAKPIGGSLSVIIQQFKSSVTRWCRKEGISHFMWQSRFFDHIIRDERSLNRIREYIQINPQKWEYDRENENDIPSESKEKIWKEILSGSSS